MPETDDEDCDLEGVGSNKEVEAYRGPTVRLEEYHEVAKSNEDHHVDVLEERVVCLHFVSSIETRGTRCQLTWMHAIRVLCEKHVTDNDNNLT